MKNSEVINKIEWVGVCCELLKPIPMLINRTEKKRKSRSPKTNCSVKVFWKLAIKDANEKVPTVVRSTINKTMKAISRYL